MQNRLTLTPKPHRLHRPPIGGTVRLVGTLLVLATSLLAKPIKGLNQQQLNELHRLAEPANPSIQAEREHIETSISADRQKDTKILTSISTFLNNNGLDPLLAQATTTNTTPQPAPATATQPNKKNKAANQEKLTTLKVSCDAGLYFDSEEGELVYLKNVRLSSDSKDPAEPSFKLACSKQLMILLEKKQDTKKKATANNTDKKQAKDPETAKDAKTQLPSFGEVNRIVASGNVEIERKDEKGKKFRASAETASYNAKTRETILSGGELSIQLSPTQYLKCKTKDAWLRIEKNGSFKTSESGWYGESTTGSLKPQ